MALVSALTNRIIILTGRVTGTAETVYATPVIQDRIQSLFNTLFELEWWPQFIARQSFTLDGTTGKITGDISSICSRYSDIFNVYSDDRREPLSELPLEYNFNLVEDTNASTPRHMSALVDEPTKLFRVWPSNATGTVRVVCRTRPAAFTASSDVPFDDDAIVFGVCYQTLEEDGSNPGMIAQYRGMFENKLAQIRSSYRERDVPLDPRTSYYPTDWYTPPW